MNVRGHIVSLFLLSASCFAAPPVGSEADWQVRMKGLSEQLGIVLPELCSSRPDLEVLINGARAISELSHGLKEQRIQGKSGPPSDADPSLDFLSAEFAGQSRRAYRAFQQGSIAYGSKLLRSTTAYCIACHTRHASGPNFLNYPLSDRARGLQREERAELFVATRQFDKALAEFQEILRDEEMIRKRPFDWEKPLRQALEVAVRVKEDPEVAGQVLRIALNATSLPFYERQRLMLWQRSTAAWKKEKETKPRSEAQQIAQMRRLFKEANQAGGTAFSRAGEIQFLRASASAHDLLRKAKQPKVVAEALLVAGSSYEALSSSASGSMQEVYYEACIRRLPHTDLASDCYSRFEHSVYFGYTGSSGTHIPEDTKQLLSELKSLALPLDQKNPRSTK